MEEREFDRRTDEEAAAAAAEARAIGGEGGSEDLDPAERPVAEAGGGVAEGFEQAEEELIENAAHGEGDPVADEIPFRDEGARSGAAYGEPDEIDATEVVRDPEQEGEDPGEGPGLAAER